MRGVPIVGRSRELVAGVLEVNHGGEMTSDYINGLSMTRHLLKIRDGPECPNISRA